MRVTIRFHALLFFSLLGAGRPAAAADANAPADFTIGTTVAAPAPERYGVNLVHETELNNHGRDVGFEPVNLRIKGTATGGGASYLLNDAGQTTSYFNTLGDGLFDGATIRVYRSVAGATQLVRTDTIANYVTDGYRRANPQPLLDTTFTDTGLTAGTTYRYVVRAVDKSGNNSTGAIEVSATPNAGSPSPGAPRFFSGTFFRTDSLAPAAPSGLTAFAGNGAITLSWNANTESDLAGYYVYRKSIVESDKYKIFLATSDALNPVQAGDLYFIDASALNAPFDKINPRLPMNEIWTLRCGNGWPYGQPASKTRELYDPADQSPKPTDAGESCMRIFTSSAQECTLRQNAFTDEAGYLGALTPRHTYRVEMWLKQTGITNGTVRFYMTGDYSIASYTWTGVDATWRKYDFTFVAPNYPDPAHGTIEDVISFTGPGTLWVDKFLVYDDAEPALAFRADSTQTLTEFAPGSIRIRGGETDGKLGSTLQDFTNPDSQTRLQWGAYQGGEAYPDYNCTLPTALPLCLQTGANPWLVIGPCYNEAEWLGLIEYLAAPYDPIGHPTTDTPALKPWAYKRYLQRGNSLRTWADEFTAIRLEYGNEMWNSPVFDPWTIDGTTHGRLAEHFFSTAKSSPYFATVSSKIDFVLNGQLPSSGTNGYGPSAKQQSPSATRVDLAAYIGGFDAGINIGGGIFSDAGLQDYTMYGPTAIRASQDQQTATRDTLALQGITYQLNNYEAGPGYGLPSPTTPYDPVQELYGKSLAAGTATLDLFLYGSSKRVDPELFFCFHRGYNWSSHSWRSNGYVPQTAWLALQMANRYAGGQMVAAYINSAPTLDVRSWTSASGNTYPATPNTPLVVPYAMRNGNTWSVFVISRKITGDTPVRLRLPFDSVSAGTLYKLTGDPRANNATSYNVPITQETLTTFSPTYDFVMPPASVYLFVFNGGVPVAETNPGCTITRAIGQADTTSAGVTFLVTFSQPVSGFTTSDVVISGTAGATTTSVAEAEPFLGTRFAVSITGMQRTGSVVIDVPANAATNAAGLGNLASTAIANTIQFNFVDQLLAYDDFELAPGNAPNPPFLNGVATGAGFAAAWQIPGFNSATYGDGYKLATDTRLSFSNLKSQGSYAVGGKDFTVCSRALDVSGALSYYRVNGSSPAVLGADGTVLWLSAMMRKDSADNDRLLLFTLNSTNISVGGSNLGIGFAGSGTAAVVNGTRYWSLQVRNAANTGFDVVRTNVPVVTGQSALLVLKITFGAQDRFDVYVNPGSLGASAPSAPDATWTTSGAVDINFHTLGFSGGTTGSNQGSLDEIRLGNSFAAVTPNPGVFSFSAGAFSIVESQTISNAVITVRRLNGSAGAVSVSYGVGSGGTATPGTDYTPVNGVLTWEDNDSTDKSFIVPVLSDTLAEGTESVPLVLSNPTGGSSLGAPGAATLFIADRPFDAWRFQRFGAAANSPSAQPLADFNGDGLPNLVEYALGLEPTVPNTAALPVATAEGGYLTLVVSRAASPSDIDVTAEVSADLSTWNSGPAYTTVLVDTPTMLKIRDNTPLSAASRRFIRLSVTQH